jgi:lysyl endopeptidase
MKRALLSAPDQRIVALPALPPELFEKLQAEDAAQAQLNRRMRVGLGRQLDEPVIVNRTNTPAATWTVLPNGWRAWSIEVTSEGALGLRLGLETVNLPQGTRLLVYDPANPTAEATPITSATISGQKQIWTETVFSQTAVLECQVPPEVDPSAISFTVTALSHLYRSPFFRPKSPGCEPEVACYPAWMDDAEGVAEIDFMDSGTEYICTGCLLNDTVPSTTINYFLTANHCVGNQTVASTIQFFWFFQADTCHGTPPDQGSVPHTSGGAAFLDGIDNQSGTDFTLLRLHQSPPDGVTYLGWSTAVPTSETLTCIQHPQGLDKRISFGHKTDPGPGWEDFTGIHWSTGVTEEGSSGSPLLNANHQVIGQLYGGNSDCNHLSGTDIFGRFDLSYQMIQPWIDPDSLSTGLFPRAKGTYNGLFATGTPAIESAGFCTLTLTGKGAYTGSIQLAGKRYSFKGTFNLTDSDTTITHGGNNPITAHFTLDPSGNSDHLTGTITDGNWTASLEARRPIFNAQNPAPFAGNYTVIIPGISGSQDAPQGYGYGTLKIDATGKAKFVGSLADGTAVSQSATISQDGDWPLFGSLYRGQGLLWSQMTIDTSQAANDIRGPLSWIKTQQNGKFYPNGFDVEVTGIGSVYQKPAAGTRIIDLSSGTVSFAGGNLNSSFANSITIDTNNKVSNQSDNKLTMTFTTATGLFRGTAKSPDGQNVSFRGAAFQKGDKAYGYFLDTDQSGSVLAGP